MADVGRRTALAALLHSLAASWVRRGGPAHPDGALQGLTVRFSSPEMNDGRPATADSLTEEWAMLTGSRARMVDPGGGHPHAAPGLLEHRVFAMPLQSALGAALTGSTAALEPGRTRADGPGPVLRVTDAPPATLAATPEEACAPAPRMATPGDPPAWSPGWQVAAGTVGLLLDAPSPTPITPAPDSLPVYQIPGLMVEQLLQGRRIEYVPLFLSPVEARQAWMLLQPYCAQLARAQGAARRRNRLGAVLFSIARAAGAWSQTRGKQCTMLLSDECYSSPPDDACQRTPRCRATLDGKWHGGCGQGCGRRARRPGGPPGDCRVFPGAGGGGRRPRGGHLGAQVVYTACFVRHNLYCCMVEACQHIARIAPHCSATTRAHHSQPATASNPVSAVAAGALSTAAALWHGAVGAIDHVLYTVPMTRAWLLPRLYPPATVQRGSYAAAVAAVAAHNARVCRDGDQAEALQRLAALGTLPAPRFNPFKGMMPAEEEATCCRVPITHDALPAPEQVPPLLLVLVHPLLGQVSAMDWRLRVDMDALLEGSGYRHAALLSPRGGLLGRLQTQPVEDVEEKGTEAGEPPRGVLLVGDLGLHCRAPREKQGGTELEGSRALVTVLGGRWWRRAPVLAAPPIPLGLGCLPANCDYTDSGE